MIPNKEEPTFMMNTGYKLSSEDNNPNQTFEFTSQSSDGSAETIDPDNALEAIPSDGTAETISGDADATQLPEAGSVDSPTIDLPASGFNSNSKVAASKPPTKASRPQSRKVETSAIGSIIGNYEVLSVLGKGGMGIVYKARHVTLNRIVALKMILHGLHGGSTAIQRFLVEARAVAALQHPGIVQIFEIAEHNGLPYFSLEFVGGEDLHSALKGEPWSAKPAADMVARCDAVRTRSPDPPSRHQTRKHSPRCGKTPQDI